MKALIWPAFILMVLSASNATNAAEKQTEEGRYTVNMRTEPASPVVGKNTVTLRILDSRSRAGIEGAFVEVIPWMSVHGHGSPIKPTVKEQGDGVYIVENVHFSMEGDWELLITIRDRQAADMVMFPIKQVRK